MTTVKAHKQTHRWFSHKQTNTPCQKLSIKEHKVTSRVKS